MEPRTEAHGTETWGQPHMSPLSIRLLLLEVIIDKHLARVLDPEPASPGTCKQNACMFYQQSEPAGHKEWSTGDGGRVILEGKLHRSRTRLKRRPGALS